MEHLLISVNAVIPFVVYIGFGYFARRIGVVEEDFLKTLNRIVFRLFFPFLTFYSICQMEEGYKPDPLYVAVCTLGPVAVALLMVLIVPLLVKDDPRRGVIIQAIYRSNTILFAMPMMESIYGKANISVTAVVVTFVVPVYNVLSVIVLGYYGEGRTDLRSMVKGILTNPLIDGAIAGGLLLLLHIRLPQAILTPVAAISDMTTPLALFILGGTLHFLEIGKNIKAIFGTLFVKLLLLPAAALLLGMLLHFAPFERFLFFALFATPVATATFPMSASMGGDAELAGQLVMISTVVSVFTLFMWITLISGAGML